MANSIQDDWGYFTPIPDDFIRGSQNLSNQARWLFVLLRFHTNKISQQAFPSYELIKSQTGWTNKTISAAIKDLESKGWLKRKKGFGENTRYVLVRQSVPVETIVKPLRSSPSLREHQSVPTGTSVRPNGTSTYKELTENERTQNETTTDSSLTKFEMNTVAPTGGEPGSLFENASLGESAYPVETEITIPPQCANSDIAVHPAPPVSLDVAPQSLFAPLESGNSTPPVKTQPTRKSARKRTASPADPRAAHPAIVAYRDVTTRFPVKPVWNQIIEIVGLEPDLERMRACFVEWSARGGNPGNYSVWLRDWYVKNQIEEIKQLKEKKNEKPFKTREERMRRIAELAEADEARRLNC